MDSGTSRPGRRAFVIGATAAVIAFDPARIGWVTAASAAEDGIKIPDLDGELVVDKEARALAADDYGHIVHRDPVAVLRPGSVQDIVRMVRFANRQRIKVAMRGQGHSTFGQAQVAAGVVIDSRNLARIHRVSADGAVVDAGVQWLDLVRATLKHGLAPPVSTDYLGLSVGGTLSVGGVGGASSHHGLQVDNVLELEVVTGDGLLLRCSARENRELFNAVLGGLGQFAIIVRATIRMIPAEATARVYHLSYDTVAALTADQRIALADGRFDYLEGQVVPVEGGGWSYLLEGVVYFTAPDVPSDPAVLAGLRPMATEIVELPYFDWLNRIFELIEQLKQLRLPNPWINLFLPDSAVEAYVAGVLSDLTPAETGDGPILLYPMRRNRFTRPFVATPDSSTVFLFAILRVALPPDQAVVQRLLRDNRALYEQARELGGTQYPVGSITMTPQDWRRHFGRDYQQFAQAKSRYDPRHVLTPGQGIFAT